jgi:YD repeat-containing protein
MVYPVNAALPRSPESYFADIGKITHFFGKTVTVGGVRVADEKISYLKFGDRATSLPSTLTFKGTNKTDTLSYVYDRMGNICEIRENGRIKARYAYDALGRLIRERKGKAHGASVGF